MIETRSLAHLLGRIGVVEERVRQVVAARRAVDPDPDDAFRGLYLSDAAVDRLLDPKPAAVDWPDTTDRLEPNEALTVTLTSPAGATIGDGTAVGTINDDD